MELVTAAEMRALDRAAIDERNIPAIRLMENAGKAVVDEMERQFGSLRKKRVTVVAGKGQNGGDGFVAARLLKQRMAILHMTVLGSPTALKDAAAVSFKRFCSVVVMIWPGWEEPPKGAGLAGLVVSCFFCSSLRRASSLPLTSF